MKKRGEIIITLLFFLIVILAPVLTAITGEIITGEASNVPTDVSVFVLPGPPVINILSPENKTYLNENVLVNYSIRNDIDSVWYVLDNGENISLDSDADNEFYLDVLKMGHKLDIFANNSYGISQTSVEFSVFEEPVEPPPSSSSGGGGGGGAPSVSEFSLDQDLIQVLIKQGDNKRKTLKISNIGNTILDFNLDVGDLSRFLILSEESFSLKPGENKEINIDIFAREEEAVDSYVGQLIISAGGKNKIVNFIIGIQGKQPLFDMIVKVLTKMVEPGEDVKIGLEMINVGDLNNFDILLYYSVRDFEGNTLVFKEESIAIDKELDITRKIHVPNEFSYGTYVLYSKISYGDLMASGTDVFKVGKRKPSTFYLGLVVVFCLVAAFIIHLQGRKKLSKK